MNKKNDVYAIRPSGRHLLTIGRDLIQNQFAAIIELVKNSYDADSNEIHISFHVNESRDKLAITLEDDGHGMSRDTVINKWLVPSTDDKLKRRISPNGRVMQGRKGVGRYAASILGDDLLLVTTTSKEEQTTVILDWKDFEEAEYLSDVEILVETNKLKCPQGTILTIIGNQSHIELWGNRQIDVLKKELKKMISPVRNILSNKSNEDRFNITLYFNEFWSEQNLTIEEVIKPYPIMEHFDYQISGQIGKDGKGILKYINQRAKNTITEMIKFELSDTGCGKLSFDIRVYDREPDAIEQLIKRGITDGKGNYLGKLETRKLLNDYNGIGVYRNAFRIRPLGDADFDWLELNIKRVQNPSLRIGSNQVIGYVQIESEDISKLEEKSARDGLKENLAYEMLRKITGIVISKLEERRFEFRKKAGLSRTTIKVERELERLFAFDDLKKGIRKKLTQAGVSNKTTDNIIEIITKEEKDVNLIVEDIKRTVAIYQGQATLGKIINVILHEGRRPLNYFKNQIPNLNFWSNKLKEEYEEKTLNEIIPIADGIGHNADIFVNLFKRLDPLSAGKRDKKKLFELKEIIDKSFQIFETELMENDIKFEIKSSGNTSIMGWQQDIYAIFINLIDNSIYWIKEKKCKKRIITVNIIGNKEAVEYIDYRDSGPGIELHLIESEVIFEPEFSTKPNGTGLGLAIAGEAAHRNNFELKAFESDSGAYFRVQPK